MDSHCVRLALPMQPRIFDLILPECMLDYRFGSHSTGTEHK